MKFKRFMALALAGVMTLGMASSVMAEDDWVTAFGFTKNVTIGESAESSSVVFTLEKYAGKLNDGDPESPAFDFTSKTFTKEKFTSSDNTYAVANIENEIDSVLTTPGVYNFKLSETTPDKQDAEWGWTVKDSTVYYIRALVSKVDGQTDLDKKFIIYKETTSDTGETTKTKTKEITFNNTFRQKAWENNENASLTLQKTVPDASYEEKDKEYSFNVNVVLAAGESSDKTYTVKYSGTTPARADGTIKAGENTIALKNGEIASFIGVPVGTKVTVTETTTNAITNLDEVSYTGKINGSDIQGSAKASTGSCSTSEQTLGKDENSIVFTNTYKTIDPTGLALNIAPFVAMFAAVGAAIAMYVAAKRRVR